MIRSSFLRLAGDGHRRLLSHPEGRQILVGMAGKEMLDALPFAASVEIGAEQTLDDEVDLGARHPLEDRAADGGVRSEAAAQEEVIAMDALAGRSALAQGGALQADVADPVMSAGMRAAVEVEPQPRDR